MYPNGYERNQLTKLLGKVFQSSTSRKEMSSHVCFFLVEMHFPSLKFYAKVAKEENADFFLPKHSKSSKNSKLLEKRMHKFPLQNGNCYYQHE